MPIISNSVQNNGRSSSSATPRAQTYRSNGSSVRLQEGQTLKGVVTDVHGNEITLSMDDGSSFTGKMPDANQYSIGQKAAFQITTLSDKTIYLKAVNGAYLLDMEDTIEQALEEANLPKTERNLDVVRSLLQNQQSISRENILASIRFCTQFPDADVDAVITMKRLGLPLTKESVAQFMDYQKQNHQLLYKMDALTDSVGHMMESVGTQVPRLAKEVGARILSLALEGTPSPEELALPLRQASDSASGTGSSVPALFDAKGNPVAPEMLAGGTVTEVFDENGAPVPKELLEQYAKAASGEAGAGQGAETGSAGKTAPALTAEEEAAAMAGQNDAAEEAGESASGSPLTRMRQLFSSLTDGSSAIRSAVAKSGFAGDFRTPFIHEQAGFILPPAERENFGRFLSDYPLPASVKEGIADGTITAREFLTEIRNAFPQMTEEQAGKLLASKSFQAMVKGQFMSNWTISPEHMKDPGAMNEVYDQMAKHFEALAKFSEQTFGKDIFPQITDSARNMQDNMDFMRTLNQTFQYIQLPLKLQNQNAHGDLYVMTRKEALKKDPKNLSVLLHLEMEALGTLDIRLARNNTAISAHFYVSRKPTKDLLERNMELLSDAINEQGFAFTSEMSMKEKDVDIVKDFIGAEAPVGDFKRYNFDLRA